MQAQLAGRAMHERIKFPTYVPSKESFSNYRMRVDGVVAARYPDLCGATETMPANEASSRALSAHLLMALPEALLDSF